MSVFGEALRAAARPKRRVFFSFHYGEDINRVNVVRNSWRIRPDDGMAPAEWFDNSIWEETKRTGEAALKRLIQAGMANSSVTCVLAGQHTWSRPWVRYEIAHAVARGNGLLTVHIDGVRCMRTGRGARGPNPLNYLALGRDPDGRAFIWELFQGQWRKYPRYPEAVTWPRWLAEVTDIRRVRPLSHGAVAYDYAQQNGYENLSGWTQLAADRAGR